MKKSKAERAKSFEDFKNEMTNMTDEEYNERNRRLAISLRHHLSKMSFKERRRFHKKLYKRIKESNIIDLKKKAKKKKTAKRAKKLSKKMLKEAKKASKLAE